MRIFIWFLLIKALFCFSEGKPCPEKYRPHKTRCDSYYKCVILPSKSHVWMPAKCERGLIFEPNLKLCVLPGDDWECNAGENTSTELNNDSQMKTDEDENVFVPANLDKNEIVEDQIESSGDGPVEVSSKEHDSSKLRENFDELPETLSKVDPKLKSQLQRLSQIIDGLQNTYKNKKNSTSNELRPDQLNAFLAHFNIKNEFDSFNPNNDDFKIENFGYRRQDYNNDESSSGHSNSQIVVNRPEGSVVFSLANPQKPYQEQKYNDVNKHDPFDYNTVPKISEETLKTVLELSKQMISNQNVRQVLPNMGGIYQPILTPLYYPPMPSHSYHFHTTGGSPDIKYPNYHSNIQNHYHELPEKDDEKYDKFTSTAYITNNKKHKPEKTTVIQNSVIPVHITTHSDKGIIKRPEISSFSGNRHDSIADENDFNQIPELPTNLNNQYLSPSKSILNPNFAISSTSTSAPMTTATTTERPYQYPPSPPTNHMSFLNYYTPNPHLDDSNANSIFENADEGHYPILSGQYQHNKKPSYYYQTNIKVPSSQSQSNQNIQIQPQQPQYLLNMGMNSIGNSINANINEGMEQMNEYESNSSPLSSLNYHMGKPCPEKYRPHKTRCDSYYKCVILPSKSHVWMPAKCERGLIFEPNLKLCVLPGDDWECNAGENTSTGITLDDNNIYGIDLLKITPDAPTKAQ
ncbi:uncharacterized protein LOC129615190 [Condylostylus longicornis]|uniref:uncharacterized protein LOC129615190 n=1 Tax=Condylostylus longicornis TaxID=2530218 RepID=UPI00244E0045|nr:uncharacterized protein LOC129615190 [Condylostylus longicornis]